MPYVAARPTDYRRYDVFALDRDLEPKKRLTTDGFSSQPAISRDGKRIAFSTGREGEAPPDGGSRKNAVYTMDITGANQRPLLNGETGSQPDWSPDGKKIIFERDDTLASVSADGSGLGVLMPKRDDEQYFEPKWSPSRDKIAFVRSPGRDEPSEAWTMNPDGNGSKKISGILRLTPPERLAWSPDGRRVAFAASNSPDPYPASPIHVWSYDLDAGKLRRFRDATSSYVAIGPWTGEGLLFLKNIRGPESSLMRTSSESSQSVGLKVYEPPTYAMFQIEANRACF